jgi:hypothetical protein
MTDVTEGWRSKFLGERPRRAIGRDRTRGWSGRSRRPSPMATRSVLPRVGPLRATAQAASLAEISGGLRVITMPAVAACWSAASCAGDLVTLCRHLRRRRAAGAPPDPVQLTRVNQPR